MIKLRKYQEETINIIRNNFENGQTRQYVEMPTGSGKTITFLSYAFKYSNNPLIIVPSRELLNQVYETALLFYEKDKITRKGNGYDEDFSFGDIHIAIINSMRGDYLAHCVDYFDLFIIDEAHHSQSDSYRRLVKTLDFTGLEHFLGVTATPERSDGLLLKDIFHNCTVKLNVLDLIRDGFLSDIEGYSVKTKIDISDIDAHNGDFNINSLYKRLCTENRNNLIIDICKNEMKERKVLVFCINIKHSQEINKLLNENGISSKHIDGKCKSDERKSILSAFKEGQIQALTNCQLLTEGFDEPSIDGIILARPTKSRTLFNQMIGRGLRISPGKKNCKIIDIVDNHKMLQGFNSIIADYKRPEIEIFESIKDIENHIRNEDWKISEYEIERTNLLGEKEYQSLSPTDSMMEYLNENKILYYSPSFDEASFMIWFNEIKKEYLNGINKRA